METRFLESLIAVAQNGSIASAARHQNISPATIALRLKTLEAEFGEKLIQRTGRNVSLTNAGVRILKIAQEVVMNIQNMHDYAKNNEIIGQLSVGIIGSTALGVLAPIMKEFQMASPSCSVFIRRNISSLLYQAVLDGDLDAAIIVKPSHSIPKMCRWLSLHLEPLVIIAPLNIEIQDAHKALTENILLRNKAIFWGGDIADLYLKNAEIDVHFQYELDAFDTVLSLVECGIGIALIPDALGLRNGRKVKKYNLPIEGFNREIGIIWNRSSIRITQIDLLIKIISNVFDKILVMQS